MDITNPGRVWKFIFHTMFPDLYWEAKEAAQDALQDLCYDGRDKAVHFRERHRQAYMLWYVVVAVWQRIERFAARNRCALEGHEWVDTSNIGPESGVESGHCTRCSFSFHHTYY